MAKKLYVGGFPYSTTEQELRAHFEQAGAVVSVSILMDRMTGRSRGFGFAEMEDADAMKAIEMLDGKDFGGRKLTVNEARPKTESDNRGGDRGGDRGGYNRGGDRSDRGGDRGGYRN